MRDVLHRGDTRHGLDGMAMRMKCGNLTLGQVEGFDKLIKTVTQQLTKCVIDCIDTAGDGLILFTNQISALRRGYRHDQENGQFHNGHPLLPGISN